MERKAGILLAVSSLPSRYGIGDFGPNAFKFVKDIKKAGFKIWQILPLNTLGFGNSPYQPLSSKAIDPVYISLDLLVEQGLLSNEDLYAWKARSPRVDYETVKVKKEEKLKKAYKKFISLGKNKEFEKFKQNNDWVFKYAVFINFKNLNQLRMWSEWKLEHQLWIEDNSKVDIKQYKEEIDFEMWKQFVLFSQFSKLKQFANENGIQIMGDIPFYVGIDSLDVWENQNCFLLGVDKKPTFIAGVPPDYFSEDGQRWGNPIYNWEYLRNHNYDFWLDRLEFNSKVFDIIRIDHFRAFDSYWKIPSSCPTAREGEWIHGPAYEFFDTLYAKYKEINIIAEDLGDLFDSVEVLRDYYKLPGMNVLQFTFEPYKDEFGVKNIENQIIYTGTHDNETVNGWINRISNDERNAIKAKLIRLGYDYDDFAEAFVRMSFNNIANYAIIPMQDLLGQDNFYRMNTPSTIGSPNWEYRLSSFSVFEKRIPMIKELIKNSGR